ncbi:MAG: hypothetical protein RL508_133, partial [Actinomycetota bacterium]
MKATFLYGSGDVRVEEVSYPTIIKPTDAIIRTVVACVCGSDLWDYYNFPAGRERVAKGHETIGIVEEIGSAVKNIKVGDLVVVPFVASCGHCDFCLQGLQTSCRS